MQPLAHGKERLAPGSERISLAFRVIALDRFLAPALTPPRYLGRVPVSLRRETGNGRIRRKLVGDRPCIEL